MFFNLSTLNYMFEIIQKKDTDEFNGICDRQVECDNFSHQGD